MPRGEHRTSVLLSKEENDQVFSLIGPKCQSLATSVVQIFTTDGPAHLEWKKRDTGVLCLVKDNAKRSYFFRVYCLYRKALVWEHEVYTQIEYKSPRPFLHTFEAEDYMTAFNFANEDEAKLLRTILIEKIELRRKTREEKRQRALTASRSHPGVRHNGAPPPPSPAPEPEPAPAPAPAPFLPPKAALPGLPANNSSYNTLSKKKGGRKITKEDIGAPQNFKHVSHVGWNAQKGFDVDQLPNDDDLLSFFSKAGVSVTQLQDDETREFIYGFIEKNGGLDAVKEDLDQAIPSKGVCRPPPLPATPLPAAPPVPERSPAQPPAPPSRAPPPPPARAVPPPPAVPRAPPPRPPQPPTSAPPSVPPPPPPGAPPPPPPPPAPLAPPPPPDCAPASSPAPSPAAPDPRAMLMESIRSGGKHLKKVEVSTDLPPVEPDSRSNLLSDIRKGISLKKTEVSRSTSSSNSSVRGGGGGAGACGLAAALARALEDRSRAIHSSESEGDDNSDDDDDDWD